jgi:putative tricarboxylic transport membrane protein
MSFWIGVLLFVLSLHFLLKNLFFFKGEAGKAAVLINWRLNILIIGMLIFYAVTLERLGFIVSVFILISMLFAVSKTMKWYMVVGGAMLIAFASHILFSVLLRIRLPLGVLSFLR